MEVAQDVEIESFYIGFIVEQNSKGIKSNWCFHYQTQICWPDTKLTRD